jgi:hypothetical protein
MFMDAAFVDASAELVVNYDPLFFEQFKAQESHLGMDEAFQTAAAAAVVDYVPQYWDAADKALQNEGLHYEYQSAYWNEAKRLLDKSDRKGFFFKWSAVAAALIMISFAATMIGFESNLPAGAEGHLAGNADNSSSNRLAEINEISETNKGGDNSELNNENHILAQNENGQSGVGAANENLENNNIVANPNNVVNNHNSANTPKQGANNGHIGSGMNLVTATQKKNPLISIEDPVLSSLPFDMLDLQEDGLREDIRRIHFDEYRSTPSLPIPVLEINKGQHSPRGVHNVSVIMSAGVGSQWSAEQLLPSHRSSFGAEYLYSPARKLGNFEFGTRFMVHHVKQKGITTTKRTADYNIEGGVHQYWYLLQITDLIYSNVNFAVNYRLAPKHKLKANIGVDYLTAVKSNMSYKNSVHAQEITTVNNNWGVKDGANTFDLRIGFGYEFELTSRVGLMFSANAGLFDKTDDVFLGNNFQDKDVSLMFGLKYNLFRKI